MHLSLGPKKDEKEEGKADRREGKAGGAGGEPSEGKVDKKSLKRAQSTGQLLKESPLGAKKRVLNCFCKAVTRYKIFVKPNARAFE